MTLLNIINSSTKRSLEILSNVLIAEDRSLSFTFGRPDESCSSFTLIYFGRRRASRIKFFLEPLNFADHRLRCCYGQRGAIFENWPDTLFVNL